MKTPPHTRSHWLRSLLLLTCLVAGGVMPALATSQPDSTVSLPIKGRSANPMALPVVGRGKPTALAAQFRRRWLQAQVNRNNANADPLDQANSQKFERFRCASAGDPAGAVDISCNTAEFGQDVAPDNEIAIAVDPTNSQHLVAGSNDELIRYDQAGNVRNSVFFTGFFTSFDGGNTWLDGQLPLGDSGGDPSPAFDVKHGVVLMATFKGPSIAVSRSTDAGVTWSQLIVAMLGRQQPNRTIFWDKEWLTVDNYPTSPHYGRAYLVAIRDLFGPNGVFIESPIYFGYSDDGGLTWSEPKEISGTHPSCTYQTDGPTAECDEDAHPYGVVATNGTLYVHFVNSQNMSAWEVPDDFDSQLMLVKSTDGGATFTAPTPAVQLEDGASDTPFSFFPHETIWGHQITWSAIGSIAVDPTNANHLTVVFADRGTPNPNATPDCFNAPVFGGTAPFYDPCNAGPGADTDVYKVDSLNGGATWGPRTVVQHINGHGWFPWADYKPNGTLVVAWDQDTTPAPADTFVHVLKVGNHPATPLGASEHVDESLTNWVGELTTALPTICGPDYPNNPAAGKDCNWFDGDYNTLDIGADGSINVVWTGFNQLATSPQFDPFTGQAHVGYRQDAMFARR